MNNWGLFVSKNACTGLLRDPIAVFEGKIPAILCGQENIN
jgi:hypothetical protein